MQQEFLVAFASSSQASGPAGQQNGFVPAGDNTSGSIAVWLPGQGAASSPVLVPVRLVDGSVLDAADFIDFGDVSPGATITRSVFISTRDGGTLSLSRFECSDTSSVEVRWNEKKTPTPSRIAHIAYTASDVGDFSGQIQVFCEGGHYKPVTIRYRVQVVGNG